MTDTERDPTRTEDVEEALTVLKGYIGPALGTRQRKAKEALEQVRDTIRDLRSRLEEAEEERDKYREQRDFRDEQRRKAVIAYEDERRDARAARRRADRLEEAHQEIYDLLNGTAHNPPDDLCQRTLRKVSEIVAAALDSREDEGEDGNAIYCKCGHPRWAHDVTGIGEDGYKYGICGVCHECIQYRPAHADEPEGDGEWTLDRLYEDAAEWARETFPPTDPPTVARKILEEADELEDAALAESRRLVEAEAADVFIALVRLCDVAGVKLIGAVRGKLDVNRNRGWERDENGTMSHRPSPTDEPVSREGAEERVARALYNADMLDVVPMPRPTRWCDLSYEQKDRVRSSVEMALEHQRNLDPPTHADARSRDVDREKQIRERVIAIRDHLPEALADRLALTELRLIVEAHNIVRRLSDTVSEPTAAQKALDRLAVAAIEGDLHENLVAGLRRDVMRRLSDAPSGEGERDG